MGRNWTDEQRYAIEARGNALLVSAAAGSGKTAVLVERFIGRITDPENPIDADRMLVVTFTKAAAGEMRERIMQSLNAMLAADPSNTRLARQKICLARAHISTVHSFCSDLLREFFNHIDLTPDFRIGEEKEMENLRQTACDEVLNEAYCDPAFDRFAAMFSGDRDDSPLEKILLSMYSFTRSHPFPEEWLRRMLALYSTPASAEESVWGKTLMHNAADILQSGMQTMQTACALVQQEEALSEKLLPVFEQDLDQLEHLHFLCEHGSWDEVRAGIPLKFGRFPAIRAYTDDPLKNKVQKMRNNMKKALDPLESWFASSSDDCVREFKEMYPYAEQLSRLICRFSEIYAERKKEKNLLDFNDLEHLTLDLLYTRTPDGKREYSDVAREISSRFDEVMVDEYQDTNEAQDSLFAAVSGANGNRFMVGDVKQSIYGFRQAMPDIFIRYQKNFTPYDNSNPQFPACITLDRNFRSRKEVTDTVNYIFSQIMSEEVGDVSYTGGQRLVAGLPFPEGSDCRTELAVLPHEPNTSVEKQEARWIARRIRAMLDDGFLVKGDNGMRPATPGDFCILLRSANKSAHIYAEILNEEGVSAHASLTGTFFGTAEIRLALSFLRAIDNPAQDIPLLAVLMSPVYGFTPDDMAEMRLKDRDCALIVSLMQQAEQHEKCRTVLDDLSLYRRMAGTMTSETFLNYLFEKTGLEDIVLAMKDGTQRRENLRLLRQYAASYESSGYHGMSAFLRFMDQLVRRSGDLPAAEVQTEMSGSVQIMSIHKSKGLEFPVCILAGCGKEFVHDKDAVKVHAELGLGLNLFHASGKTRYKTMASLAIAARQEADDLSEEMRVLYVALTRAKEKLILVGSLKNRESALNTLAAKLNGQETISATAVRESQTVLGWLLLCALRHPDGTALRELAGSGSEILCPLPAPDWVVELPELPAEADESAVSAESMPEDSAYLEEVRRAVSFVYPWTGINELPSKVAVTSLAEARAQGDYPLAAPAFLQAQEMTAAEKGTAAHAFLQFVNLQIDPADLENECRRLVEQRFITERQLSVVNVEEIRRLLESPLGQRIRQSERVWREYRFSVPITAGEVNPEIDPRFAAEPVVLQGAIDCMFAENGKIYIVDFKTDRVKTVEALREKYARQLELYSLAAGQTLDLPVGGRMLYSLRLGRAAEV